MFWNVWQELKCRNICLVINLLQLNRQKIKCLCPTVALCLPNRTLWTVCGPEFCIVKTNQIDLTEMKHLVVFLKDLKVLYCFIVFVLFNNKKWVCLLPSPWSWNTDLHNLTTPVTLPPSYPQPHTKSRSF